MLELFKFLRTYRGRLWFSTLASIANKILDLMPPLLVGWVIATVSGQIPNWIRYFVDAGNPWHIAIFLTILAILIFGVESITQWMYSYGFMTLAQHAQHDLRIATYQQIQAREIAFFERHRTGETMSMLNDDINQLERFLNAGCNDLIQLGTLTIFACVVLFTISWQLALIGMAPIPVIIWGSLLFQRHIAPRYHKVRETVGHLASRLENNLGGIIVIKSFTAEKFETDRVKCSSNEYRKANKHAIKLSTIFIPAIRMAIALGFGGVLLFGSYWVLKGEHGLTVANLVVFSMMIQRLLWPLTHLGSTLDEYERAKASAKRTFGLLHTQPTIQDPPSATPLKRAIGKITFEHVHFHYEVKQPILKGLHFIIKPGETVGIAGQSGGGKSTLIKLLLRLYDVEKGSIKIDDIDIRNLTLFDLRRNIALVSQDVYLFHGTIQENIAYGLENISLEHIVNAAKLAQLNHFVSSLPNGYDTLIGERGVKLSGGQRQRLSIARAILKDAPILILDEATSAVDTETERAIQQNLRQLTAGKTALIIAHRLSTIRDADRILVLHEGHIIEEGHHDDLVNLGGSYAELWNVQCGIIEPLPDEALLHTSQSTSA